MLGILIVITGILPFLGEGSLGILPAFIPTSGLGYSIVVIIIGAIGIIYGITNNMVMGTEKFVTIAISIMTILGGVLPFISSLIPEYVPTSGPLYSGLIIIIGGIGIVYGMISMG